MVRVLVAVALVAACRGNRAAPKPDDASRHPRGEVPAVSVVPTLPRSDDGAAAMRALDAAIDAASADDHKRVTLLLERAWIRGQLDDYVRVVAETGAMVERAPDDAAAWQLRVEALTRVHELDQARAALERLAQLVDRSVVAELALTLDHAAGKLDVVLPARAERAKLYPNAQTLTLYAVTLAEVGRHDEAIALVPKAAAKIRNNTPQYFGWLLFQWGRVYEHAGQLAAARDLFAAAHRRLPAHVETIEHLADTYAATGDRPAAAALAATAAAVNPHPALRTLVYRHAPSAAARPAAEPIAAAWNRYVTALPRAFADHAARALLSLGTDPARAFALARLSFDSRPTAQARELAIETALELEDEPQLACSYAGPFLAAGSRRQRFLAWKALGACGRTAEADALARDLRIVP